MRTALGLALCLGFNLGCILYCSPYYTSPRPVFFNMMGLILAFLGPECLFSQSLQRAKAMGAAAYVIFAGPLGLGVILGGVLNLALALRACAGMAYIRVFAHRALDWPPAILPHPLGPLAPTEPRRIALGRSQ